MKSMPRKRTLHLRLAAAVFLAATVAGAQAPSLEECLPGIEENPADPVGYYCVYRSVLAHGHLDEAAALLRMKFRENPEVYRIEMIIAWVDRMRDQPDADTLLREAIDGMESTGDAFGVVYGGVDLAARLGRKGAYDEAEAMLTRCDEAALKTGDPMMRARVWTAQGNLAQYRGDYSRWLHLTRRAQQVVFPDGPYDIRCWVLDNLGAAYWYLCRYAEAFDAFERASQLRERAHDLWSQVASVYNMALCAQNLLQEGTMEAGEYQELLQWGHDLAIESGNLTAEAEMVLLQGRQHKGEEALQHYDRALNIARRRGLIDTEVHALQFSGVTLAEMGPQFRQESDQFFLRARQRAQETSWQFLLGQVLAAEAWAKVLHGTREEAIEAHLTALDSIEALRAPQVRGTIRAQAFTYWDFVYYRLAGFLLQGAASSAIPNDDRALAFHTLERFRARELLESMERPLQLRQGGSPSTAYSNREDVLTQISEVQRTLSNPDLSPASRETALRQLESLENSESDLRDQLLRESPASAALHQPTIPDIADVQALLAPDQALLSYQLWDDESRKKRPLEIGRSWLMLITSDRVQTIALPNRRDLRSRVAILEGFLITRDVAEISGIKASVRLYEDLLHEALAMMPKEIRRLVIIPDDVLFRLPFGALRRSEGALPIGSHLEISVLPSAAVWVHLKNTVREALPGSGSAALVLFAPEVGELVERDVHFRTGDPWREGLRLAPLDHAGREARALMRVAGKASLMLTGADASERALKETTLGDFQIIDLVTHAVVDEVQPERSAILLAPGSDEEDGFLQVREIPDLELEGQLVILSSCRSSSGRILGGEGAQSLARAFLEAGAGAVLAGLWPLEDQEAAELFGNFSRALGQGRRVADALRMAQGSAIEDGMSPATWAGLVILGDGDLRPLPDKGPLTWWWTLTGIVIFLLLAAFIGAKAITIIKNLHKDGVITVKEAEGVDPQLLSFYEVDTKVE